MTKPINLRQARKARARDAARAEADANAARHGRPKAEKRAEAAERERSLRDHEGKRIEEE